MRIAAALPHLAGRMTAAKERYRKSRRPLCPFVCRSGPWPIPRGAVGFIKEEGSWCGTAFDFLGYADRITSRRFKRRS